MDLNIFWIIAAVVVVLMLIGLLFKTLFSVLIRLLPLVLLGLLVVWLLTSVLKVC